MSDDLKRRRKELDERLSIINKRKEYLSICNKVNAVNKNVGGDVYNISLSVYVRGK